MAWGKLLNRWHDEGRVFHYLSANGSPRCGARYYTSSGAYPKDMVNEHAKCKTCRKIEIRDNAIVKR